MQWYFTFKLGDKGVTDRTEYLRNQLSALSTGDVVITTNWDPLVEQLLAQEGRWIPTDGYGFQRGMGLLSGLRRVALPGGLGVVSEIQVLKLHGCFGWRDLDDGFFLEGNEFLSQFRFAFEGRRIQMRDMDEPTSYRPSNPIIAFPSYLKSLIHSTLFEVWRTASLVISDCSDFAAAGYSLPASDSAVRALLLPIANGARTGRVRVTIADPAKATLDTWREFLGHNPKFLQLGLEAAPVLLDG
ncbi:MAG TPA: hypothetical protein VJN95_06305 [Gemmatimonadales bacterium]|nr:hypothetical protein [Gemmatimonadales bacterium]